MATTNQCMWPTKKLKDCVVQLNTGLNPRDNFTLGTGDIKYITAKNLTDAGTIDFNNCDYIDAHAKEIVHKRSDIRKGDILFGSRAPIGHCYLITDEPDYFDVGESIFCIRVNTDVILPEYLCLYLSSNYFVEMASKRVTGSVIKEIRIGDLLDTDVVVPPEDRQAQSARCISKIDKKITNNISICSDLEAMAKLLYDYWFVQFDFPDENEKPYKSSGGRMVWSEELKREIPEGWEVKPLASFIAKSKNGDWGNDAPKRKDDIGVTCFRGADFSSITDDYQVTAPTRFISAKNIDRLLSDGDLVTEISGGSPTQATGRVGYINQKFLDRNGGKMVCSNFCKAFTPQKRYYQYWLYQTWKAYYNAGAMFNYESKTTGIKNLMFDELVTWIRVPAPADDDLMMEYQNICSLYYDKIQDGFMESTELSSLRDFLLPMLMNGQVKVGKVGA